MDTTTAIKLLEGELSAITGYASTARNEHSRIREDLAIREGDCSWTPELIERLRDKLQGAMCNLQYYLGRADQCRRLLSMLKEKGTPDGAQV